MLGLGGVGDGEVARPLLVHATGPVLRRRTGATRLPLGLDTWALRATRAQLVLRAAICAGKAPGSPGDPRRGLQRRTAPSPRSWLAPLSRGQLWGARGLGSGDFLRHRGARFPAPQTGRLGRTRPPVWNGRPHAPPPSGVRGRGLGSRGARRALLTASRPLSWAPLARRASVLDLRSISSMMPWMWPPEIPWKSMAGGRKGHALSSARHPTISIYTRPGLSAHPREGARGRSAGTLGDTGQEGQREEERQPEWQVVCLDENEGKGGAGEAAPAAPRRRCAENKQTRAERRETQEANVTAPGDRVTNEKQLRAGRGPDAGRPETSLNTKKGKAGLRAPAPGCPQVPSACRVGRGLLLPELCPIC